MSPNALLMNALLLEFPALLVHLYVPNLTYIQNDVEVMDEDVAKHLLKITKTHYTVVMEYFNAKMGVRECKELCIGSHGIGQRNQRRQTQLYFLDMQGPC